MVINIIKGLIFWETEVRASMTQKPVFPCSGAWFRNLLISHLIASVSLHENVSFPILFLQYTPRPTTYVIPFRV